MTISELTLKSRGEGPVRRLEIFTCVDRPREWLPARKAARDAGVIELEINGVAMQVGRGAVPGLLGPDTADLSRVPGFATKYRFGPHSQARLIMQAVFHSTESFPGYSIQGFTAARL